MNLEFDDRCAPPRRRTANTLLSIVLPVYNEVHVLPSLADLLADVARECRVRHEIIFVNDGSTDGSQVALDRLAARRTEVKVIHLSRNFGHQAAVQAGLCHVRGDAVVLMDSDLQDSPEAIPKFLNQWRAGYDVVYAVRTKRKEGLLKRVLFAGFHRLLSRIGTTPIPSDAGIFGLVDGRVARQIADLPERDRYLPGLRSWVGFRQIGVEVERLARYDRQPRVSLGGLWRLAKTAIFGFSSLPLLLFHAIGLLALTVFVGVSGFAIACRLFTELAIPGWTSHVMSATFFGTLNALGISILGEYVTRIYDQVRARPLYLVARTVNLPAGQGDTAPPADGESDRDMAQSVSEHSLSVNPDGVLADLVGVLSAADLEPDTDAEYFELLAEIASLVELAAQGRSRQSDDESPTGQAPAGGDAANVEHPDAAG